MNRRKFLQQLLASAASVASAPYIFDMGANLYKRKEQIWVGYDPTGSYQGILYFTGDNWRTVIDNYGNTYSVKNIPAEWVR